MTSEDIGPVIEANPFLQFVFLRQPGDTPTTVTLDLEEGHGGTVVHVIESGYTSFMDLSVA